VTVVIGVDVGGTFTDLVMRDQADGQVTVGKVPTTPHDPEIGVLNALDAVLTPAQVSRCSHFLHGTTVGLNALIERRGATVGLITTAGFRDVLEIGRGDRPDPYDLRPRPKDPLVPRRRRVEVQERIGSRGEVIQPLDASGIASIVDVFALESVDAIAVVLINSYTNPDHEMQIETELRRCGYQGDISLSYRVSGEYREYERTTTTVIDAFVRHRMGPYLRRLRDGLAERGFVGELLITRSGGGALTVGEALQRPFETILSGPVAGAAATARLAQALSLPLAIPADVGGTSFDTAAIVDGRLPLNFEGHVEGLPLQCPWVDVRSIGAGGGSLAYVDEGGLLRVGPRSAGAVPGPACYQRGGSQATVTDAALALGMLASGALSGGVGLDLAAAHHVLDNLVDASGLADRVAVAQGIMRIAASHMGEAVRGITVERGVDLRTAALVAFGGAGPLFASLLALEMDVDTVIIPSNAGNFSAVGLMQSDVSRSAARTLLRPLTPATLVEAVAVATDLGRSFGAATNSDSYELLLDLRYRGQEHSLTVALPWSLGAGAPSIDVIESQFEAEYRSAYGLNLPESVELVNVRVQRHTRLSVSRDAVSAPRWTGAADLADRSVWSFTLADWALTSVIERTSVPEAGMLGPVLIVEQTATTVVDAGFSVRPSDQESLVITRKAGAKS
jgi:N-methylhydantoinase A